jgi:hypothetical protein
MFVLGAVGHRSGGVVRGGLAGAAVGVAGAVALLVAGAAAVAAGAVAGVPGVRELLLELLFAPTVVGFFGALWVGAVLAFAGLLGLASGATGGALGRLARGD